MLNLLKTEFLFVHAQSLAKKNRLDQSIGVYESALNSRPSHSGMRLQFGLTLLRNSRYDRALVEMKRARDADPSNPVIPMFTGVALLEMGMDEEALEALEASLVINAANELCLSFKGVALLRLGRVSEGADILEKHFFIGNDFLDFFILLYCERVCAEKDVDSLAIFEKAMDSAADRGEPGLLNSLLSGLDGALDAVDHRIQRIKSRWAPSTSEEEAIFLRGMLSGLRLYAMDRVEEAEAAFGKCAELDYTPPLDKKSELCGYLYHIEAFERLDDLFEKYFGEDAEATPDIFLLKIRTATRLRKYDEALRLIEEYENAVPPDLWSQYMKGVGRIRTGNMEEAGISFKKVIAMSKQPIHKFYLTECLRKAEMNGRNTEKS